MDAIELYRAKNDYLNQYCEQLEPMEFYRALFPAGTFERQGQQQDAKPNGIALVIKGNRQAYHHIITDELAEIEYLLQQDFVILSPIGYFGQRRLGRYARYLYALAFDLDGVELPQLRDLLYQIDNGILPAPTVIVNSGHGVHLYYFLREPVPLYPKNQKYLKTLKYALTTLIWNQYTSTREDREYQGILQGFRMVGSTSKLSAACPLTAFYCGAGKSVDIEYLASFVRRKEDVEALKATLQPRLPLEEAKKKYPEWYDRRIVKGAPAGQWNIKPALYYWWLNRLKTEITVGHRYYGILTLAVYARKCPCITEEQLRQDAYSVLKRLDALTNDPQNRFTEDDVEAALEAYTADDSALLVKWTRDHIQRVTGLDMPANKRNGLKQEQHLKIALYTQSIKDPKGAWRANPSQQQRVWAYFDKNPTATPKEAIEALELSKSTVYRHYATWKEKRD
jgi:hypothetical protein